jgi:putative acyl-CoA dehydrogenase
MSDFFQVPPTLQNTYRENRWLKTYLKHKLPADTFAVANPDLERLGQECASGYLALARRAEREKPVHVPFDAWGNRIDEIRVSTAWEELQNVSAREGMIAIAYERKFGEFSRVYQFAKLYLFHPSSAFFSCPLAMADGAAKVLEIHGKDSVHKEAFRHLTSRDPREFWTSGQWMTEKTGGSDVGPTSTEARVEAGQPRLYGTKWFSSATTSQMALALARLPGSPAGSKGLTLFHVPTYSSPGRLNHIKVLRLKDKLGTWALPTAELQLEGAYATQLGATDQGVKTVSSMLNITRLHNSACSIGQATRALEQLRDYSTKRSVFGQPLDNQVLHYSTFAEEELKTLTGFLLTFELVHLLGKEECKTMSAGEAEILRLMTPVCKLFTAREAIHTASEVIEGFGGAGYIEDTGLPVHLRDSQVFPIWEGATNVLSLDMIRVVQKTEAMRALKEDVRARLKDMRTQGLEFYVFGAHTALTELEKNLQMWLRSPPEAQLASSRGLAFHLARLYGFVLLLSWADKESEENRRVLEPWVEHFSENYLRPWHPISEEACVRTKRMWTDRLKL